MSATTTTTVYHKTLVVLIVQDLIVQHLRYRLAIASEKRWWLLLATIEIAIH